MNASRARWVDGWRGLAVVAMVIFHFVFDVDYLGLHTFKLHDGIWLLLARFAQITFVSVAGLSLYLARRGGFQKQLKRAGVLLFFALLITAVTYFGIGEGYVRFGILHLIAIGILLGYPLANRPLLAGIAGIVIFSLGKITAAKTVSGPWLIPLGLPPAGFYTLDYFPLIPWFGLMLCGITLGGWLENTGALKTGPAGNTLLEKIGRHSLAIYLLHQPVLLLILWACRAFLPA